MSAKITHQGRKIYTEKFTKRWILFEEGFCSFAPSNVLRMHLNTFFKCSEQLRRSQWMKPAQRGSSVLQLRCHSGWWWCSWARFLTWKAASIENHRIHVTTLRINNRVGPQEVGSEWLTYFVRIIYFRGNKKTNQIRIPASFLNQKKIQGKFGIVKKLDFLTSHGNIRFLVSWWTDRFAHPLCAFHVDEEGEDPHGPVHTSGTFLCWKLKQECLVALCRALLHLQLGIQPAGRRWIFFGGD